SGENKCASLNNSLLLSSRNLGTLRELLRALGFLNVRDPGVLCCKHCWIPDIKTSNLSLCSRCFSKFRDDKRGDSFQVLPLAGFFIALVSTHLFHALLIFPRTPVRFCGDDTRGKHNKVSSHLMSIL
ncbi:MAG: hypothetical protein K2W92_05275, partial [Alphaproteobacteria bacterium]|nr:hypothetical protein [Alphaproteobacteria bacterium]